MYKYVFCKVNSSNKHKNKKLLFPKSRGETNHFTYDKCWIETVTFVDTGATRIYILIMEWIKDTLQNAIEYI
jgi:hypothetical protein